MNNVQEINVLEVLKAELNDEPKAETPDEGDIIFDKISPMIENEKINAIVIDFTEIKTFTPSFINNAIGKLFLNHQVEKVYEKIVIKGITNQHDLILVRESIKNAVEFSEKNV